MSNDLGLPWRACEADIWSVIVDAGGGRVARFCDWASRDHAIACVQALNGIDPTKLAAVFEAIRGLYEPCTTPTLVDRVGVFESACRAAGIIGDKT